MIIYLYVKTHNITGLKYLGKTTAKDPDKYTGSGTYWKRHLRLHGYDYTTEILKECTSNEEVAELGLYYSELWNVVESIEWANLVPESGDSGTRGLRHTEETRKKMSAAKKGNCMSDETRKKISEAKSGKKQAPLSDETRKKISDSQKGKPKSDGHRKKLSAANKGKKNAPHSDETRKKMSESAKWRLPMSDEHRKKRSDSARGKKRGPYLKKPSEENIRCE